VLAGAPEPLLAHPGHEFEGFRILSHAAAPRTLVAGCSCGEALATAEAAFAPCPECAGGAGCARCGGSGEVIDHRALVWRYPEERGGR
jgi:hypothetical protein